MRRGQGQHRLVHAGLFLWSVSLVCFFGLFAIHMPAQYTLPNRIYSEFARLTRDACFELHAAGKALIKALQIGAGNQVRTGDLNLGKVALYQLSYSRLAVIGLGDE